MIVRGEDAGEQRRYALTDTKWYRRERSRFVDIQDSSGKVIKPHRFHSPIQEKERKDLILLHKIKVITLVY